MSTTEQTTPPEQRTREPGEIPAEPLSSRLIRWGVALAIILPVLWASAGLEGFSISRLLFRAPGDMWNILKEMFPPDLSVLPTVIDASIETFHIALLGTVISIAFSLVLGALAAETVTPRIVHVPMKWLLATIRGIPLILIAMLMVGAVGLGPLPGILAIAFHSTGMLGKFYAESLEGVPASSLEALDSAGATWLQKMRFGAWPHMAPNIVRDTLFRFELNVRESLVLGLVGAGGIGFYIQTYIRAFQYDRAATLTVVVILFIVLIEAVNHVVRSSLR